MRKVREMQQARYEVETAEQRAKLAAIADHLDYSQRIESFKDYVPFHLLGWLDFAEGIVSQYPKNLGDLAADTINGSIVYSQGTVSGSHGSSASLKELALFIPKHYKTVQPKGSL
jgi:hypothetical protein